MNQVSVCQFHPLVLTVTLVCVYIYLTDSYYSQKLRDVKSENKIENCKAGQWLWWRMMMFSERAHANTIMHGEGIKSHSSAAEASEVVL